MDREPKTFCKECGKHIPTANFLIHEGRCQVQSHLRSSRVSNQSHENDSEYSSSKKSYPNHQNTTNSRMPIFSSNSKQEKRQIEEKGLENNPEFSSPNMFRKRQKREENSYPSISESHRRESVRPNQVEEMQKIPCHFCGYMQTLQELDTHPNRCEHRQTDCRFCGSKFPQSLMRDHEAICQHNPDNEDSEQSQYSNSSSMRRSNPYDHSHSRSQRHHHHQHPFYQASNLMQAFFQHLQPPRHQSDRHHDLDHSNRYPHQQPRSPQHHFNMFTISNQGPRVIFSTSSSSNPGTFFQLIEMLANRHGHRNENPGMTQQEMQALEKVKYKKDPKSVDPDICTVCYCEFEEGEEMIRLECKHEYHPECIFEWLKRTSTCPVCKKKLKNVSRSNRSSQESDFLEEEDDDSNYYRRESGGNGGGSGNGSGSGGGFFDSIYRGVMRR